MRGYKGIDVLLRAMLRVPDVTLTVAGEIWGDAGDEIRRRHPRPLRLLTLRPPSLLRPGLLHPTRLTPRHTHAIHPSSLDDRLIRPAHNVAPSGDNPHTIAMEGS